jgi:CheY-like chemotaxis protein
MPSDKKSPRVTALIEAWRARVEAREQAKAEGRLPEAPTLSASAPTVLVVDDDDETRAVIQEALEEAGYRVLEAREGDEALMVADWHDGPIDLVVTDVMMPYVDGSELGQRLRPLRADTKVLYISGYAADTLFSGGRADPDVPFLPKPFTPDELVGRVRDLLSGTAAR